jgi:integrase/recombinase XerC
LLGGLRVGEIAALDVADVSLSAKLGVVKIWHGKGNKSREVPLHSEARKALSAYLLTRKGDSALFTGRDGRLGTRSVGQIVVKSGKRAGIDNLTPHVLRHTFATNLIRSGTDITLVADLLGHASLDTTRRYSLPSAGDRARAVESLPTDA